eukprot:11854560-Karenia_brevis.AAC.1
MDGVATPPSPTPLAQSHLQKIQELQELQELYQLSLAEKGENHLQTKVLAQGLEKLGPQTSP